MTRKSDDDKDGRDGRDGKAFHPGCPFEGLDRRKADMLVRASAMNKGRALLTWLAGISAVVGACAWTVYQTASYAITVDGLSAGQSGIAERVAMVEQRVQGHEVTLAEVKAMRDDVRDIKALMYEVVRGAYGRALSGTNGQASSREPDGGNG